jgi:restriction endonuclease S subunit
MEENRKRYVPTDEEAKEIAKICEAIHKLHRKIISEKKHGELDNEDMCKLNSLTALKRITCGCGPSVFYELRKKVQNRARVR